VQAFLKTHRLVGSLAAAVFCLCQASEAAAAVDTGPMRVLGTTSATIQLPPIRLEELADRAVEPISAAPRRAVHTNGALIANGQLSLPPIRTQITRTIRSAWTLRVPAARGMTASSFTRVDAHVESAAGNDRLADPQHPDSGIVVEVHAKPAQVVSMDKSATTLQGDIELTLDISDIKTAGRYTGRVVITLEGT